MTSAPPDPDIVDEDLSSADDLAGSLRTELSRLAFHLRTPATRSGITPTRLAALAAIARHDQGCRQGDLAAEMGFSAAGMTRLVDIMIEARWVLRERDPSDARALVLRLSSHGQRTLEALRNEGTAGCQPTSNISPTTSAGPWPQPSRSCVASPTAASPQIRPARDSEQRS